MITTVWIILTMTFHQVESDVITVNNDGQNPTRCCVDGECHCSSLFNALQHIRNSIVIDITSESVELHDYTRVNSAKNIKITGNNVVVCCNNTTGSVSFASITNVTIHGITWDQCGNPNDSLDNNVGISFRGTTILTIDEHSQMCAVSLISVLGDIIIKSSSFISNGLNKTIGSRSGEGDCGGLKISTAIGSIVISDSVFSGNGKSINRQHIPIYGLSIGIYGSNMTLIISRTDFVSNFCGMFLDADVATFSTFVLSEVNVSDNMNGGINLLGIQVENGDINMMILNSTFNNNGNGGLNGFLVANHAIDLLIDGSNFSDNRAIEFSNRALSIAIYAVSLSVNIKHSNFINNTNGTIYISTSLGEMVHLVYHTTR